MEAALNTEVVADIIAHLGRQQEVLAEYATARGVSCTVYESAATPPFLSPALFKAVAADPLQRLLAACGDERALIAGGKTHLIVEQLVGVGANYLICPREADGEEFMYALRSRDDIEVRVNMDPAVFEGDDDLALEAELRRAASIASIKPGSVIGTGVLSYGARPEIVERAASLASNLG
jgi:hypothetical protein